MKRLSEYNLTDEEIRDLFGSRNVYERNLKWYGEDSICGDDEKRRIAFVLFWRGKKNEAKRIIESIEDEEARRRGLEQYAYWDSPPLKLVNPFPPRRPK